MRFVIAETSTIKEICMKTGTGYDIMGDLIADSGMSARVPYDRAVHAYRISQQDFDWWMEYFDNAEADEAAFDALCDRYGSDAVDAVIKRHQLVLLDERDYDVRHTRMQAAIRLVREALADCD